MKNLISSSLEIYLNQFQGKLFLKVKTALLFFISLERNYLSEPESILDYALKSLHNVKTQFAECCTLTQRYGVSPPYLWVLHPQIQPTTDQKYLKKETPKSSKKLNLDLPCATRMNPRLNEILCRHALLQPICIQRSCANTTPVFIRHLSILSFCFPQASWSQTPTDTKGWCFS